MFGRNTKSTEVRRSWWITTAAIAALAQLFSPLGLSMALASGTSSDPTQAAAPSYNSAGVSDVMKMVDAKVDANVIKAYIQNSSTAYNPSATEIIALKQHGVSDDVLTAMLVRGGEMRGQAGQVSAPPADSAATAPATPSNSMAPYADGAQPVTAPNANSYPEYGYGYPNYGYYPYYGYGYLWPYWGWGWGWYSAAWWPWWGGGGYCGSWCGFHGSFCCNHFPFHDHHDGHGGGIHGSGSGHSGSMTASATSGQGFHAAGTMTTRTASGQSVHAGAQTMGARAPASSQTASVRTPAASQAFHSGSQTMGRSTVSSQAGRPATQSIGARSFAGGHPYSMASYNGGYRSSVGTTYHYAGGVVRSAGAGYGGFGGFHGGGGGFHGGGVGGLHGAMGGFHGGGGGFHGGGGHR
jgi:hypothetical protein